MDKYEISLWEDYLDVTDENVPFLNERKICVIGSDNKFMGARAVEPKMVTNINGTNTFTFKMYYKYTDEITGEKVDNPFIPLLINERKVKVFWKNQWYDLVIKSIDEDSSGKGVTYTCEDLFITELSKNGYNLQFIADLQNNNGTAAELVKQVLEGSGWSLDEEHSSQIIQETEEPVYEVMTLAAFSATCQLPSGDTSQTIQQDKNILVFYSSIIDITNTDLADKDIQFVYADSYTTDENEMLVTNGNCYISSFQAKRNGQYIEFYQDSELKFKVNTDAGVSLRYRANRLVKSQITKYDALLERYIGLYKDTETGNNVYGYAALKYSDPLMIVNFVVNPESFKNLDGWIGNDLTFGVYPKVTNSTDMSTYIGTSYLRLTSGNIYNSAFTSNKQYLTPTQMEIKRGDIGGIQVGEKYIFRLKFKNDCNDPSTVEYAHSNNIQPIISKYTDAFAPTGQNYFDVEGPVANEDWNEYTLTCNTSCSAEDIPTLGLFLNVGSACWLEQAQLYKYSVGIRSYDETAEEERIDPGEVALQGIAKTYYNYYNIDHADAETAEELVFIYSSDVDSDRFEPVYNNYEKIASIEEEKSNRFNILQSIAEAFQCWIRFTINHDEAGRTVYNDDGTAQKYITIVDSIGEDLGWSFEYGIDLKSIKRKIISNDLATKIIVIPNENEFAQDGFCTIARSNLNYSKENFILNLDYFINQGLLDKQTVEQDLYSTSSDYIGYYYLLHQYNGEYDEITETLKQKQLELTKQQAESTVLEEKNKALQQELTSNKSDIMMLVGVETWEDAQAYIRSYSTNAKIQSIMNNISRLEKTLSENESLIEELNQSIQTLEEYIETQTERQAELFSLTDALHSQFFNKYSRFIQEGTWQDDNYIDDNQYYLDALQVAYTSSRPQVEYTIDVMRLSALEDFSSKIFNIGDICYVQDKEFFGYCADKITPYKLKITISEITSFFDQPEKDTIKVQNYKTQFDDLFQRITATTQNLEYEQGGYRKAASAVNPDGTFSPDFLQNSFDSNQNLILNASNQQVTWDATGITITDNTNTASKVRLMAGGLFITNDGGMTWKNAVRGDGISTDVLTAGKINTGEIYIYDGKYPSFRWDNNGLSAYSLRDNSVDFNKFVRFDKYGIYGYNGSNNFVPTSEDDIKRYANFGLTWEGFFLKNSNANTTFEISTDNDLMIKSGNVTRLRIGRLDNTGTNYGFQLRDVYGNLIFSVNDEEAILGGWNIGANGLQKDSSSITYDGIGFGDLTINNSGISLPSAEYLKVNGVPCLAKSTIKAQIAFGSNTAQEATISFLTDAATPSNLNIICVE